MRVLESRYGWAITYEDPPYNYTGDIVDVTLLRRRVYSPSKAPILGPKAGRFTFEYTVPNGVATPDESAIIGKLLEDYKRTGYPGLFRFMQAGGVFHIVPTQSRNMNGEFERVKSLLDSSVSVPDGDRTALRMFEAVTAELSRIHGIQIGVGTVPLNVLIQSHTHSGANNESARMVLLRAIEATDRQLSWELFCDPGSPRFCALNVHSVEKQTTVEK